MGQVKSLLMDVENFVYDHFDNDGQQLESSPVIVAKAKQKFGVSFGEYAEEVLNGEDDMYSMQQAEAEYRAEQQGMINV
jgi:hypothetical protein